MRHAAIRGAGTSAARESSLVVPLASPAPRPAPQSDQEIIAALRRGEIAALNAALARYWALVVDYITRLTGMHDAAEDAAQRTFCQLWDRREQWGADGSLRALLCRIARNLAVSERRRDGARDRSAAMFMSRPQHNPTPDVEFDNEQLRVALEAGIATLPKRRREVFVLRCVHGLSYKEIGTILDVSPQTVANQLSSALRTLRGELGHLLD